MTRECSLIHLLYLRHLSLTAVQDFKTVDRPAFRCDQVQGFSPCPSALSDTSAWTVEIGLGRIRGRTKSLSHHIDFRFNRHSPEISWTSGTQAVQHAAPAVGSSASGDFLPRALYSRQRKTLRARSRTELISRFCACSVQSCTVVCKT